LRGASPDHIGLLVVNGVLAREILVSDTVSTELLGPGDVLRPWRLHDGAMLLRHTVRWSVLAAGSRCSTAGEGRERRTPCDGARNGQIIACCAGEGRDSVIQPRVPTRRRRAVLPRSTPWCANARCGHRRPVVG
jgi:hypothetical protein